MMSIHLIDYVIDIANKRQYDINIVIIVFDKYML